MENTKVLFIKETKRFNCSLEALNLLKSKQKEASGIENIYWHHEFDKIFKVLYFKQRIFI